MKAEDKGGIMATMTHIRDVRKKAPMVTGLFGPLKDTVLLLKNRGIPMDLPPVNKQVPLCQYRFGHVSTGARPVRASEVH